MADEIKKYTNRLRDKSTNEVYYVYDEEALHADSSISLLTNDAGYIKNSELSDLLVTNPNVVKPEDLRNEVANFITHDDLGEYITRDDLSSIAISGKIVETLPADPPVNLNRLLTVEQATSYRIPVAAMGTYPEGTGSSGVLNVENLSDTLIKQEWITETGKAERIISHSLVATTKWVDRPLIFTLGDETSRYVMLNDEVYINAGGKYLVLGEFTKKITIGRLVGSNLEELTAADEDLSTVLIFDGNVNIGAYLAPNAECAIDYPSKYGSLVIIAEGENAIVIDSANISGDLSEVNEHGLRSTAAIQSKSNLFIGGTGSLSIRSNVKNHGIKADNISIKDHLELYIDLQGGHDGIHVDTDHRLLISDGKFNFLNCRDAIDMEGENSILEILGGDFTFENNEKDIDCSACTKKGRIFNMLGSTHLESEKLDNTVIITPQNIRSIYGEGIITSKDGSQVFTPDGNGVFRINSTDIVLSGYFNNKQLYLVGSDAENKSMDIYLSDAYITNNEQKQLSGKGQTILYSPESGKLAIRCEPGTTNFVYQTQAVENGDGYGAIKSKNNITIQGAGSIYVSSVLSDAIDGSNIIIKGNGFRYFETKNNDVELTKAGICGKSIVIGEEDSLEKLGEPSYQTIVTSNIIAQRNKTGDKGIFTILDNQFGNVVYNIEVFAEAEENLHPIVLDNIERYQQLITYSKFIEPVGIEDDDRFINRVYRPEYNTELGWQVFISKAIVDDRIFTLSNEFTVAINALTERVKNLEHKHLKFFPYTLPTDHRDGNIAYWYCPTCDTYYLDEEATEEVSRDAVIIPKLIPDDAEETTEDVVDANGNILQIETRDQNGLPILVEVIENN